MRVLWLYGAPGAGKSTVAWELYRRFQDPGVPQAYVDIDQLGMCYPPPPTDPERHRLKARNLAAVLANFASAGARFAFVSGVLDPQLLDTYARQGAGIHMTFCRLTVGREELRRRNVRRGLSERDVVSSAREADELDAARLRHALVDTEGRSPAEVADEVIGRTAFGPAAADGCAAGEPRPAANSLAGEPRPVANSLAGRILWFCGPTAVGKSSIGFATYRHLLDLGRTAAFADLEQLGFLRPAPAGDGHGHRLKLANLATLWRTAHAAGGRHLVVVGALYRNQEVDLYRQGFGAAELTVCRLQAGEADLRDRIAARGRGGGPLLAGDALRHQPAEVLDRAFEAALSEQRTLTTAGIGDLTLDTSGKTVEEVVAEVDAATHLP